MIEKFLCSNIFVNPFCKNCSFWGFYTEYEFKDFFVFDARLFSSRDETTYASRSLTTEHEMSTVLFFAWVFVESIELLSKGDNVFSVFKYIEFKMSLLNRCHMVSWCQKLKCLHYSMEYIKFFNVFLKYLQLYQWQKLLNNWTHWHFTVTWVDFF